MPEKRSITIQGNAQQTVLVTGDGNRVTLARTGEMVFRLLDEAYRRQQMELAPADFYNGTRSNWSNIAREQDAPRQLLTPLLDFLSQSEPAQRAGIITGLSGEGKTTLIMRLAWEASKRGMVVLWRHGGMVEAPYERPFDQAQQVLIYIDDLPYVDGLSRLLGDLSESGLPFVLLGTGRTHEWQNSPVRSEAACLVAWQEFPLERLSKAEAQRVLERLETHDALGVLIKYPPHQWLAFFLDRLQADGQLLPDLFTARAGKGLQAILEDVFDRLQKRWGEEKAGFLLRGYAGIALVHRFGFWMSRPLLARFLEINEADLTPRLLTSLRGELTEVTEADDYRLYTRHPWIAERVITLLASNRLPGERYLYEDLFRALGALLASDPEAEELKLLTKIPLAFKYRGEPETACHFFGLADQADPKDIPTLHAWALLKKEQGNFERARELFEQASQADPKDVPTLQFWKSINLSMITAKID